MKIGKRLLWTNGRGNYYPKSLCWGHADGGHGKNAHDSLRKGLNSKIRHMAKKEIIEQLNEE